MSTTIPTIPSLPAGYVVQLADLQNLAAAATFLLNRPMTRIRDTAGTQSITTSPAPVTYSVADFDTDGMWSSGSPDRLTIQTPGWYRVRHVTNCGTAALSYVTWVTSTTGSNNPQGAGVTSAPAWSGYANTSGTNGARPRGCGIWPAYLYAGDYIQVKVQASGSSGTLGTSAPGSATQGGSFLSLEYVSI